MGEQINFYIDILIRLVTAVVEMFGIVMIVMVGVRGGSFDGYDGGTLVEVVTVMYSF